MSSIVYYLVPRSCIYFDKKQNEIFELDLTEFQQINIGDALDKNLRKPLFINTSFGLADFPHEIAKILWGIKHSNETLLLRKKATKYKKQYSTEEIETMECLIDKISDVTVQSYGYAFLYTCNGIMKYVDITRGGIVEIFVKNSQVNITEQMIAKWAKKTEYYSYELDLDQ